MLMNLEQISVVYNDHKKCWINMLPVKITHQYLLATIYETFTAFHVPFLSKP